MRIGTKSLLFGAHQFLLHPLFVAEAWRRLYGWPRDLRLWIAFLVHDWGYWGLADMDGAAGQQHPARGGRIMAWLFGAYWGDFCRLHSRYYARLEGREVSALCAADKLATAIVPQWLYLLQARLSGELAEYMALARAHDFYTGDDPREWLTLLQAHWREIAYQQATIYQALTAGHNKKVVLFGAGREGR